MTLVRRVRIGRSAENSSPFRVAITGIDADGSLAQFDNLLFDANQPPLRISSTGWASVAVLDRYTDANAPKFRLDRVIPFPSVPAGTAPMFMITWREPNLSAEPNPAGICRTCRCSPDQQSAGGGMGGAMSSGWLNSLQFNATIKLPSGQPGGAVSATIWTYVILQNFL